MNPNSIQRFVELAKAGKHPTASRGEWVCHQIAAALCKIHDDLMLLDADAADGAAALMRAAAGPFLTSAEKHAIYQMIKDAGSKRRNRRQLEPRRLNS